MFQWFWTTGIFSLGAPDFLYNFTLDNSNIFYFPWRSELSGVDCTCKFVSYFFWLIETKWSKFTILSHQWIFAFRNMNWYANFKTPMSRNSSNVTLIESFKLTSLIRRYKMKVWLSEMEKGRSRCLIRSVNENQKNKGNEA